MKPLDIKLKIAALVALLLLVGMVLLDMVMVFAAQRLLTNSEKEKGTLLIDLIGTRMISADKEEVSADLLTDEQREGILQILTSSNVAAAVWVNARGEIHWLTGEKDGEAASCLKRISRIARNRQGLQVDTAGSTWGVFWRQRKYLVIAGPFFQNHRIAGVAGISIRLEPVFSQLRNAQEFVGYYLLINTLILSFVGIYRIQKMAIRPILKIIGRAEAFRPGDAAFSLEEAGENELSRLSRAINRVFDLNREDQEKLRQTVSRLEEAMARLKQAQQEIIRAEKLTTIGRLASGVAHEIGNPIGIVIGYLELIRQGIGDDAESADYLRRATEEVERIRSIIRQLLDYARPSQESRKPVPIHDLLGDVIQMAVVQPLFADLVLESDFAAEEDIVIGDSDQLRQLFLNFILNAADAIKMSGKEDRGRIRISSKNDKDGQSGGGEPQSILRIFFEDNGSGISKADLDKIFDPFFTTKPPGMGSGLGLWVSLLMAEAMGGTIKAHSDAGKGTRMELVLPVDAGRGKAIDGNE